MQTIQSESSPQSKDVIRNFLQSCHTGVLATASATGDPHAATVYLSTVDDFCFLLATKIETQKYKNIKENNKIALVCTDEATETTMQLQGHTVEVTDEAETQKAINTMYRLSNSGSRVEFPPLEKLYAGDYIALKIIPKAIRLAIYARPDSQSNEELYETLEFTSE